MFVLMFTLHADVSVAVIWEYPRLNSNLTTDGTTFRAVSFEPAFLMIIFLVPDEATIRALKVDAIKILHFRFATAYHETTPDGPPPEGGGVGRPVPRRVPPWVKPRTIPLRSAAPQGSEDVGEYTDDHGEDESPDHDLDNVILGLVRDESVLKHEVHLLSQMLLQVEIVFCSNRDNT